MAVRPLRKIIAAQAIIVAVLPFAITAVLGFMWFFPHLQADIETSQLQIATTISTKTEAFLNQAMKVIQGIAALPLEEYLKLHDIQKISDSQRRIATALQSIYIVNKHGRVQAVSLKDNRKQQQIDLTDLDLSRNSLYRKVNNTGTGVWSDAFLSVVGADISVAYAAPSGSMVVIGEIDLGQLSNYLKDISPGLEEIVLVVDRKGQVIADKGGIYTAQQLNISNLPIVREGSGSTAVQIQRFKFERRDLIGILVNTALLDWHILVAIDRSAAYRPMKAALAIFTIALLAAVMIGIFAAVAVSKRLAQRFEALADHARHVSRGSSSALWPRANITEFDALAGDLQQMADTIREREAYNRLLFADSSIPHTVIHPDTAEFVDCNDTALKLFGVVSRKELIGKVMADLSPPNQYDGTDSTIAALRHIETCRGKGTHTFKWRHQRIDGQLRDCEVSLSMFRHGTQPLIQAILLDVTLRRMAEQKVAEEKHKLEALAAGTKGFNEILEIPTILQRLLDTSLELTDAESGTIGLQQQDKVVFTEYIENGRVRCVHYVFAEGHGVAGHVMQTRQPYLTNEATDDPHVDRVIQKELGIVALVNIPIINTVGEFVGCLELYKQLPGSRFEDADIDLLVGLASSAAIAINNAYALEQEKAAREAFLESEKRFRLLMQQSPAVIELYDSDGLQVAVNRAYEIMWGFPAETTLNEFNILKSKEVEATGLMAYIKKAYAGEVAKVPPYEFDPTGDTEARGKGRRRWLNTLVYPLKDTSGAVKNVVVTHEDISEIKYAEEKRKHLETQLRQAQKMEAIGTLAGGIAHDFNNILSAVIGYTEIALDDDLPPHAPARSSLENVLKAGFRAKDLVKQILAFSRQTQYEKKPITLGPIVKEVMKLLRASLPSTIEIRHNVSAGNSTIMGDPVQIHQVLMNLCTNAGYAMRESGGILEVTLSMVEDQMISSQPLADMQAVPYVMLGISDTGTGMPPSVQEQIFDPFYTTKPKEEGTGLGLSVVHGIVTEHGGTISVDSQPGEGTTFRVFFPLVAESITTDNTSEMPLPSGDERILVVDDEQPIANALQKMLERLGYTITAVSGSREALDLFSEYPDRFDLVITDQTMPVMTGDQLALKILELRPNIPVILCTGFSHVVNEAHAKQIGIREYITKPVARRDLALVVRRVLDQR